MATVRVVVALDPARLLRRASSDLFPLRLSSTEHPWPTLAAWLVLRQGGLRDDLHVLAASCGVTGWFDPPVCVFSELAARWHEGTHDSLSSPERNALLSATINRSGSPVFTRNTSGWIPAIDRAIGELIGEGTSPDAFAAALAARTECDAFEMERDSALCSIYRAYTVSLAHAGRTDGRDARVQLASAINADPAAFARQLGGRRDIRIVGLADLRGGWRSLLAALATSPAVDTISLFSSHALVLPSELQATVEYDEVDSATATATDAARSAHPSSHFIEAPDNAREIEIVAVRVRALLHAGADPRRIAVVSRDARPAVNDMAVALEKLGVPVTARRRVSLASTGPARALHALLAAPTQRWSRHATLEIAEHPLLGIDVDATVMNVVGMTSPIRSRADWLEGLSRLLGQCRQRDDNASHGGEHSRAQRSLSRTSHVESTLAAWRAWQPRGLWLDEAHTVAEWFGWTIEVLERNDWGVAARIASADAAIMRADTIAMLRIAELAASWRAALNAFGGSDTRMNAEAFDAELGLVLREDLIIQPETGFGVVVAEALAAAWRPFDHVFMIGLASGEFPRRPPPSPVLGDPERRALVAAGLPIDEPDAWRGRERELFRVLCAAPRISLTLSWPAVDTGGHEVARSAYVDECLAAYAGSPVTIPPQQSITPGFPVVARHGASGAVEHARRVAKTERARSRALSPHNGAITDAALVADLRHRFGESYTWSATSLEELAKCPWSWMARRLLHLEERSEADDSIEPTVTGRILHAALDAFFGTARTRCGDPAFLRAHDADWANDAIGAALETAWDMEGRVSWLGVPAFRSVVKAELLDQLHKYIAFEIDYNEKSFDNRTNASRNVRTGAHLGELPFDGVTISVNGASFRLRGSIDRVDRGIDERVTNSRSYIAAIDYKSTIYSTPAGGKRGGWDDGVVLQVPLYAEVLRQLFPEDTLTRLEYRTLRLPRTVHDLQFTALEKPDRKTNMRTVSDNPDAAVKFSAALAAAAARVQQVLRAEFPTDPAPSCGCSPFCSARDVCRIPGGPVSTGWP